MNILRTIFDDSVNKEIFVIQMIDYNNFIDINFLEKIEDYEFKNFLFYSNYCMISNLYEIFNIIHINRNLFYKKIKCSSNIEIENIYKLFVVYNFINFSNFEHKFKIFDIKTVLKVFMIDKEIFKKFNYFFKLNKKNKEEFQIEFAKFISNKIFNNIFLDTYALNFVIILLNQTYLNFLKIYIKNF